MLKILTSLHGRLLGLNRHSQLQSRAGFVAGGDDQPAIAIPGSPDTPAFFTDFHGLAVDVAGAGDFGLYYGTSDTGQSHTRQAFTNGVHRMTASATSAQEPIGGAMGVNTSAQYKANQGRLRMSMRVKMTGLDGENVFVGFTDTGQNELAAYDTGAGILTPAADYAGFIFSAETTTLKALGWRGVAGKAGTDQTATFSSVQLPTVNVWDRLEVDMNESGNLIRFAVNGKIVGQIANAGITPTVALAAGAWHANTDAAAESFDADWLAVSAARDTGT